MTTEEAVARARAGDATAFAAVVEPWRREVHAHCYRMLGSAADADDAAQETLVNAWRSFADFEGRSSVRTWLHRIATRVCLTAIERRGRRALPMDLGPSSERSQRGEPATDIAWLGPWPEGPDDRVQDRESVELAFVAALQHLPGNQRAALLLFEVLGFSADEIADQMATTRASVNSALQRARAVVREKVPDPSQQRTLRALGDARLHEIVGRYASALERGDAAGLVGLLTEDVTWSMPPLPHWYAGLDAVTDFLLDQPLSRAWRHRFTTANGQPAVVGYQRDEDDGVFRAYVLDVLTLREDRIAQVTAFIGPEHVARCGMPAELPPDAPMNPRR
ncbi:sigma-70 family RNA polymerase sigma factor [Actinomycetospora sp. OC33-EN08]|uniref:Sigma-70 family RNA polymerase sigma factor n=1 Tax=Actinomycetospora aurantiaca TaxID=3129233 RepID=A0ABU8MKR8_9PSEU